MMLYSYILIKLFIHNDLLYYKSIS
jgi:hypothetical protein